MLVVSKSALSDIMSYKAALRLVVGTTISWLDRSKTTVWHAVQHLSADTSGGRDMLQSAPLRGSLCAKARAATSTQVVGSFGPVP